MYRMSAEIYRILFSVAGVIRIYRILAFSEPWKCSLQPGPHQNQCLLPVPKNLGARLGQDSRRSRILVHYRVWFSVNTFRNIQYVLCSL